LKPLYIGKKLVSGFAELITFEIPDFDQHSVDKDPGAVQSFVI